MLFEEVLGSVGAGLGLFVEGLEPGGVMHLFRSRTWPGVHWVQVSKLAEQRLQPDKVQGLIRTKAVMVVSGP